MSRLAKSHRLDQKTNVIRWRWDPSRLSFTWGASSEQNVCEEWFGWFNIPKSSIKKESHVAFVLKLPEEKRCVRLIFWAFVNFKYIVAGNPNSLVCVWCGVLCVFYCCCGLFLVLFVCFFKEVGVSCQIGCLPSVSLTSFAFNFKM